MDQAKSGLISVRRLKSSVSQRSGNEFYKVKVTGGAIKILILPLYPGEIISVLIQVTEKNFTRWVAESYFCPSSRQQTFPEYAGSNKNVE